MPATPNSILSPQAMNCKQIQFTSANGMVKQTLFTAGANGSFVRGINAAGTHTTPRLLQIWLNDGVNSYEAWLSSVVNAAGTSTTAAKAVLNSTDAPFLPLDTNGNHYLWLPSSWSLQANLDANTDALTHLNVQAIGEDL